MMTKRLCCRCPGDQYWEDADDFNPDRFINDKNEIVTPEAFIPFGFGKQIVLLQRVNNKSGSRCAETRHRGLANYLDF